MIFDQYTLFWLFYISIIQRLPRYLVQHILKTRKKEKILTSKKGFNNMSLEISSWDFCTRMFLICLVSFRLLYYITNKYSSYIIVQSGILIPLWLFITGSLVRLIYYFFVSRQHWKHYLMLTEEQKQIYWITVPVIVSIVFLYYDKNLSLMIIAILLGKFMWLDFSIKPLFIHDLVDFINRNGLIIVILKDFCIFILFGAGISISFIPK